MAKPSILSLFPTDGPTTGNTEVDITGTNLDSPAIMWVEFGGTRGKIKKVHSDFSATVVSPKRAAGTVNVVVNNGQSSDTSDKTRFTFNAAVRQGKLKKPLRAVTIASVTPANGPTTGGTQVVITGTNFNGATAVNFGTSVVVLPSFTVDNNNKITVPSSPAHAAGTVDVQVTSPAGQSPPSAPMDFFTYVNVPTVTGLQPSSGPRTGNTMVIITGTNFTNVTNVTFGGTPAIFTVMSSTMISATSPSVPGPGPVTVRVTNAAGTSASNPPNDQFTYT